MGTKRIFDKTMIGFYREYTEELIKSLAAWIRYYLMDKCHANSRWNKAFQVNLNHKLSVILRESETIWLPMDTKKTEMCQVCGKYATVTLSFGLKKINRSRFMVMDNVPTKFNKPWLIFLKLLIERGIFTKFHCDLDI